MSAHTALWENIICGLKKMALDLNLRVYFTDVREKEEEFFSYRGEEALEEAKKQLIIQKKYGSWFIDYLVERNKDIYNPDWEVAADKAGVKIELEGWEEELKENIQKAELFAKEGTAIYIDGKKYNGRISTKPLLKFVCKSRKLTICENLPEYDSDDDCRREGKIGECINPGERDARCVFRDAIPVKMTTIISDECIECEPELLIKGIREFFPGIKVKELTLKDTLARRLVEDLGIPRLPAYVFEPAIKDTQSLNKAIEAGFLKEVNHRYVLDPETTPAGYYLDFELKPKILDIFTMAQCAYGIEAENTLIPMSRESGLQLNIHYIAKEDTIGRIESMHGIAEVEEDVRQLCARKYYGDKHLHYILCRNKNINSTLWERCAEVSGISPRVIKRCQYEEGKELLRRDIQLARTQREAMTRVPALFEFN